MRHTLVPTLAAACLLLQAPMARADVLTFFSGVGGFGTGGVCTNNPDGTGAANPSCGGGAYISQSYGDTAAIDVTYKDIAAPGPAVVSLRWWDTGYSGLSAIAYSGTQDPSWARIELKANAPGDLVALNSFDLGAWQGAMSRNTTVNVYSLDGLTTLYTNDPATVPFSGGLNLPPASVSFLGGLRIEWKSTSFLVGIDNINYSVATIPEPSSIALLLAGLGLVGLKLSRARE